MEDKDDHYNNDMYLEIRVICNRIGTVISWPGVEEKAL